MRIVVDHDKCQGSGECVRICPYNAIEIVDGKAQVNDYLCDLDGLCIPACPHGAIHYADEEPQTS